MTFWAWPSQKTLVLTLDELWEEWQEGFWALILFSSLSSKLLRCLIIGFLSSGLSGLSRVLHFVGIIGLWLAGSLAAAVAVVAVAVTVCEEGGWKYSGS